VKNPLFRKKSQKEDIYNSTKLPWDRFDRVDDVGKQTIYPEDIGIEKKSNRGLTPKPPADKNGNWQGNSERDSQRKASQ